MNRLENKTAIITGAAGGMGKAMAILFAKQGAQVLVTDIQEEKLSAWVKDAKSQNLAIDYMLHDVSNEEGWKAVIDKAFNLFGKIDILINNAGIYPAGATTESTTVEDWNKVFAINVTGPFIGAKLSAPFMRRVGGGAIINISSIAGMVGGNGPAYSASKGALRLLSKDQAIEYASANIRVNSIHPGGILTPMTEGITSSPDGQELLKNICPMQRIGTADEIAYAALYLASDESSYTTGTEMVIDGGLIAR